MPSTDVLPYAAKHSNLACLNAEAAHPVTQQHALQDQLNAAEEDEQGDTAIQVVLTGAVAKVVFKNAIQAIPHSLDFRHNFLKLLVQFKFEGISAIQQAILDSIYRDFGDTEQSWDLKARAACADSASELPSPQVASFWMVSHAVYIPVWLVAPVWLKIYSMLELLSSPHSLASL